MYGDMMYCNNCGKPFMDVWHGHDTRQNKKLLSNCSHCMSCSVFNASQFIENYEKHAPNQHSNTILYKHIKNLFETWAVSWWASEQEEVFLTKKEQENVRKNLAILSSPKVYI